MWIELKRKLTAFFQNRQASKDPVLHVGSIEEGIKIAKSELPSDRVVKLVCKSHTCFIKKCTLNDEDTVPYSDLIEGEKNSLLFLKEQGVPVPEIIEYCHDFLVLSDCGSDLRDLILSKNYNPENVRKACFEAGRALARLHMKGISLGRGRPKDYCWDGRAIRFIDFEQTPKDFDAKTNGRANLWNFVFHLLRDFARMKRDGYSEVRSFLEGYVAVDHPSTNSAIRQTRFWAQGQRWRAFYFKLIALLRLPGYNTRHQAMTPAVRMFTHDFDPQSTSET